MGLLSDAGLEENLASLRLVYGEVLDNWHRSILHDEGLELEIGTMSMDRICLIGEALFDGRTFPKQPGPFKRAAAVCALTRMFGQMWFKPTSRPEALTKAENMAMQARFALSTVPVIFSLMTAELDGTEVRMTKKWVPSTLHLQIELLAWLRWLEKPLVPAAESNMRERVDLSRLQRTVMGLAMIIEQSYYLVGATVECEVMHKASNCLASVNEDPILWQDLTVFYRVDRVDRE